MYFFPEVRLLCCDAEWVLSWWMRAIGGQPREGQLGACADSLYVRISRRSSVGRVDELNGVERAPVRVLASEPVGVADGLGWW